MDEAVYICTGGCGAVISQKEYNEGVQECGAQGCVHHGHPFEKRLKCGHCQALYKEGESHEC